MCALLSFQNSSHRCWTHSFHIGGRGGGVDTNVTLWNSPLATWCENYEENAHLRIQLLCTQTTAFGFIFVLRKKGSKTKKRMKEEEIEKGDCGPPTRKVFFWDVVELEPSGTWSPRRRESNALAGYEDGPVVYPANAFDSHLRGD